jgi:hypothetical protein
MLSVSPDVPASPPRDPSVVDIEIEDEFGHWLHTLSTLPFGTTVFVAGSAATWLAERALFQCEPDWCPNDVDVFVIESVAAFGKIVAEFLSVNDVLEVAVPCKNIINVRVRHMQIVFSFVRCFRDASASAVLCSFDIDICKVMLTNAYGCWRLSLSSDVLTNIRLGIMHCVVRRRWCCPWRYPLQKSLRRAAKYRARGYQFASLSFDAGAVELIADDFLAMTVRADG